MKIVKFITGVSKKLAKAESWKLPSKKPAPPALPAPPLAAVDEANPVVEKVAAPVEEEVKDEEPKLAPVVEEPPIQPVQRQLEEPIPEPTPPTRKRALLIGIQFYPDPNAPEQVLEPPVAPPVPPPPPSTASPPPSTALSSVAATAASTPAPSAPVSRAETSTSTTGNPLASSSSLTSIASRAKAKFKQTISSPLASTSTLASISHSTPPPPLPLGKKTYAAAVSPRAGLSHAPSAWPALVSGASVTSPTGGVLSPTTPKGPAAKVPLKPGRSFRQEPKPAKKKTKKGEKEEVEKVKEQEQDAKRVEEAAEKVQEEEKPKKKKKKDNGHNKEISVASSNSYALKGCHRDVAEMERALIELYHYPPSSITTMLDTRDNVDSNSHLLPTRDNILRQIQLLVEDAREGDKFFFFFAGHSTQEATDSLDEEDGMDELIVTYDNSTIRDDELRQLLVVPLPIGAKLTAVFDSCHSASLLDLEHFRCNRTWVPWMNKGKRRSLSRLEWVVRRAAAPMSPRRHSPVYVTSPISTFNNPLSPIFDFERIRRVMSKRRRKEAAATMEAQAMKEAEEERRREEAKALEQAQQRARGLDQVLSESLAGVPPPSSSGNAKKPAADEKENLPPTAPKENMKPPRPDPRNRQRAKIVPPPIYDGWMKSSLDRMNLGRGSVSSEAPLPSAGKASPAPAVTSILTGGTVTTTPIQADGKRAKIKLTPIRTTSLHPEEVPTRPVSPIQQHVTFTPQTYTPMSSRRDSVVVGGGQPQQGSRRGSLQLGRRESLIQHHGHQQMRIGSGMEKVLEEAFARHASKKKETHLTDISNRTDLTDKTDRTDKTWPASDVSDDSGIFWLCSEPEEYLGLTDEEDEEDEGEDEQRRGRRERMPSLGATSSMAMALSRAPSVSAVSASKARARAWSKDVTEKAAAAKEKGKKVKKKAGMRRHPRRCMSPEERFCTGWCRKEWERGGVDGKKMMPFVISLSAAKDGQQAWEDASGASMTHHLVAILRREPTPNLERLLSLISHDLHATYLDIHSTAREYRKKAREHNKKLIMKGKEAREVFPVEMNNFQDPQVSSLWPLDMKSEFWDP